MLDKIVAHTSFIGHTGYANHSRNFFTRLNKYIPVKVRNFAHAEDTSYLTDEQRDMIYYNTYHDEVPYNKHTNDFDNCVHIVLNETNHYYFYQDYVGPKIAYNVWESTRQPEHFFKRLLQYDQIWVPSEWQRQCTIEQGCPPEKVRVVPEGVDGNKFHPQFTIKEREKLFSKYDIPKDAFVFMIFGRWDYRKSTTEMIRSFLEEFGDDDNVYLVTSVDNPFPADGLKTTEERLKKHGLESDKIKVLHFPPDEEYVKWLQLGDVYLSCSRSEGWNLPLIEAIACGCVTICSNFGAQLEFAEGVSHKADIAEMRKPHEVFMFRNHDLPGEWSEPDFEHLKHVMRDCYKNYVEYREKAFRDSVRIREKFDWENAVAIAIQNIDEIGKIYSSDMYKVNDGYNDIFVYVDKEGNPRVETHGEVDVKYVVAFENNLEEQNQYQTVIGNKHFCVTFAKDISQTNPVLNIEIMSEHGFCASFVFNNITKQLRQCNTEEIDISSLQPPVILTGSIGGGTSYISKFLRFCGLHMGSDACHIERRKTHESKTFKNLEEVARFRDDDFMIEIRGDKDIRKIRDNIDKNLDKYVRLFKKNVGYKLNNFFEGVDARDKVKWGWKSPISTFGVPIYTSLFPEAKILNIRKNKNKYRDTSKTDAGKWFYDQSKPYSIDSYFNPDLRNKICSDEDRKAITEAYKDYTSKVSSEEYAISINTALYLYFLCEKFKPRRILERGSGFSSFVFGYYKKNYPDVQVDTVDTEEKWLNKTLAFLDDYYGIEVDNAYLWEDFQDSDDIYDFIFEDTRTELRKQTVDKVFDMMSEDGIIVFDDANRHDYLKDKAMEYDTRYFSLKKYTYDKFGRFTALCTDMDIDMDDLCPTDDIRYMSFERFVSDYKYANEILRWIGLPEFQNQNEFADMLDATKFEGKVRRENDNDEVIVINSYTDTDEKKETLKKCIKQLKKTKKEIILTTHYPVDLETQELVDYYVYDTHNTLLDKGCFYWFENSHLFYRSDKFGLSRKAFANQTAMRNGIELAKRLGKEFFYYIEYDSIIDDEELEKLDDLRMKIDIEDKKGYAQLVTQNRRVGNYSDQYVNEDSLSLIFFAFYTDFFLENFDFAETKEEYERRSREVKGLEWFFYDNMFKSFKDITFDKSTKTYPIYFQKSVFGSCKSGEKTLHYIDIVKDRDSDKKILFISFQDVKEGSYDIEMFDKDGEQINKISLPIVGRYFYDFLGPRVHSVKVKYGDTIAYENEVEEELSTPSSFFFFKKEKKTFDIDYNFFKGPYIEIKSDERMKFKVDFIDRDTNEIVHSGNIESNCWIKANREYYANWKINIENNGNVHTLKQDLKNKNVLMSFESKSLGDTLAWIPYMEEFRKKHECNVIVSTFWNHILDYPNLKLVSPGSVSPDIYARYEIGCFDDLNKNPKRWMDTPLQKIASDILGLEYKEIRPRVKMGPWPRDEVDKYIAVSEHSTALCKYWNYKGGWQQVVDYINSIGYMPMVISKEKTKLKNVEKRTGKDIKETMKNLQESKLLITVSTGLAWLAWAMNIPVIMISGCTHDWNEFSCERVINKNVCHGCLNDSKYTFDKGKWDWCPENKNFECTRSIHPQEIIKRIEKYK